MKKVILIMLIAFSCKNMLSQSTIDAILSSVEQNNKSLSAYNKFIEAEKLSYKTGLTPGNPSVNYDYMIGYPSSAGNQTDFTVTQAFDFPSAYIKKKQLSNEKISQLEFYLTSKRQEVLLETKLICIELVYHHKYQSMLENRKNEAESLQSNYQKKLTTGDISILDFNKVQLQLIEVNKDYQINLSKINQLNQKLTELNGGNEIIFTDTIYPVLLEIPEFDALENEIEKTDPIRKTLEQEISIAENQLKLAKAMSLPKLETGYHYQGILGQTFQGVHFGITIPLWEDKNKVKQQKETLAFSDLELEAHKNEHYYDIKQLYEKYIGLKNTIQKYESVLNTFDSNVLLSKAFQLGEISTTEYFLETNYYYNSYNNYLLTEKEFYQVITTLNKHKL